MQDRRYHITREGRDALGLSPHPGSDRLDQINNGLSGRTDITEDCELCSGNIHLEGEEKERVINELDEAIQEKIGEKYMKEGEEEYQEEKEREAREENETVAVTDGTVEPAGTVFAEENKDKLADTTTTDAPITDPSHLLTDEDEMANEASCGCGTDGAELSGITAEDLADGAVITEVTDLIDEDGNRTIIVESLEIEPVDETQKITDNLQQESKDQ